MKRLSQLIAILVAFSVAASVAFAAASYPTSIKSFATRLASETIQPAHMNDVQDEINAIETALLNGFQHALKPLTTGTQDLGTSTLGWQQLFLDLGTITADAQAIDIKGTWNAAGVTFTLIKGNVTNTASAAASLLLNLQVNGNSALTVDKTGKFVLDKPASDAGKLELQDFGTGGGAGVISPNVYTRVFRADSGLYLSRNASLDLTAQTWSRDDIAQKAQLVEIGQGGIFMYAAAAAANPITWTQQIFADHLGITLGVAGGIIKFREKIEPDTDNTKDIGLNTLRWRDGFFGTSVRIGQATNAMRLGVHQIEGEEIVAPAAPAANRGIIFFQDNGAGKTQLCARFPTGATQCFATEP